MTYTPREGSAAFKVVQYLKTLPPGTEVHTRELARTIGFPLHHCNALLKQAVVGGALRRRELNPEKYNCGLVWSLGDGTPQPEPPKRVIVKKPLQMVTVSAAKLDPNLPVVIPAGVKVTKCPNFEDRRFKAEPGHPTPFMDEWRRRTA